MRHSAALAASFSCLLAMPATAWADAPVEGGGESDAFTLGQIIVAAPSPQAPTISSSTLDAEAIRQFERYTLDDAVNLMPGVSSSNSGGSRNERLIFVRGFDRYQVPLSIDGIRVYLPADGRLDYGRFLTGDIAQVQVAKGYASLLDGPGAMGGAVNLVTRKPAKALEAEARGTLNLDRDADYAGYNVFALLGTRQDMWYAQASYTRNFQDHWDLPGDYSPVEGSAEDGGERGLSRSTDWRLNAKVGFTPNDTDEYSLSYTRQEGSKNAPLHVTDPVSSQRNWTWPYWNIDSIYFLSTTALGDRATLRTRVYRNGFDNLLSAYDDATQTTQSLRRAFNSWYADTAWGGSAQLDVTISEADQLSLAAHYRRDKHVEWQQSFPAGTTEPRQSSIEETYSIAAENRLTLMPDWTFVAGVSFDWRDLKRAEDYASDALIEYPLHNASAVNAQGRLSWTPDAQTALHASISSRARFPTLFERFSSRFGGAVSNPNLKAERATNFEIGAARTFGPVHAEVSVFYSKLDDAIVSFPFIYEGQSVSQSRNLGSGEYYGAEVSITARLDDMISLGGNYTYTHRDLTDPSDSAFRPTGVPAHKGFVWVDWAPVSGLHILPNADFASNRWTVNTAGTSYYRTGDYVLANLTVSYALAEGIEIGAGARNLFDEYYVLTNGFPQPGRSYFLSLGYRY
ncbi:TonB-dependent receptor plug domain-containing protein [Novosphingobium mangrovi (ex Huang et al. 2023)]|uniref:TonB-dependent receptor n=1 Tax=Novosphingobium mangrovi (ex Huang et al. 2023) TaxID=2976432 RepID=A0ABT2I0I6_9SPHN|nr:TonB-dependent receptor [Novosphingobium mangrovi (ex Huang et al. 2023)]MCT2398317.1 TonB-dependent receptor [Novosphingobium mangrovi (ex Huang et al. 2023)]